MLRENETRPILAIANGLDSSFDDRRYSALQRKCLHRLSVHQLFKRGNQESELSRADGRVFRANALKLVSIFLAVKAAQGISAENVQVVRFG